MNIFIKSLIDTMYFVGVIITAGFILDILRNATLKNFRKSTGGKLIVLTAMIGVPIHELGHLIFAIIFRHKIIKVRLLQFKRNESTMGYVEHSYNPLSIYQQIGNFFIGIGPIIGGTLSIILLMKFLLPPLYKQFIDLSILNLNIKNLDIRLFIDIMYSYGKIMVNMVSLENLRNLNFIVFIILSICIFSHISLSKADIKGAFKGLFVFYILVVIFNYSGVSNFIPTSMLSIPSGFISDFVSVMNYNILLTSFLVISLLFSFITYLISLLFTLIKKKD